jgi:hypothetical protein
MRSVGTIVHRSQLQRALQILWGCQAQESVVSRQRKSRLGGHELTTSCSGSFDWASLLACCNMCRLPSAGVGDAKQIE